MGEVAQNLIRTYCFVTNLSFSEESTVKNRLMPYIKQVIERGFNVILVTSDSKPVEGFDDRFFTHILNPSQTKRPCSYIKRALYEWNEAKKILKSLIELDVEAVIITIPSMFLLFRASQLKNKKLFLDVRDLTWEYLPSSKPIQFVAKVFFRVLANTSFRFFSSIAVTNESEIEYFKRKNMRALMYSNGVTSQQFSDLTAITRKTSERVTVSYVGKVGMAQNLETLVLAAEILKNMKFNIVGDGPEYAKLRGLVLEKKLKNIFIHGNVSWESVVNFYQESDVLYAQLKSNYSSAMPSKLYQYLNASRFIVYGGGDQAGKTLSIFENNIVIPPDNVSELVNAIEEAKRLCGKNLCFESNVEIINNNYIREESAGNVLQEWAEL